ncbi:MAG: hypothetical protein AAGD35_21385 [Actinomycetota bacterium]
MRTNSPRPGRRLQLAVVCRLQALAASARRPESGFEIAQSMGIALLGLVVAAAFATALEGLGVDVIARIRGELGL